MYKLNYSSKDPIYQQIVEQTKSAIIKGYFKEGDKLPSIREMAKNLLVNQSTITRAYKEMESLGIITTISGKGTFISLDSKKMDWEKEKLIDKIKDIFRESIFLGMTIKDLEKLYEEVEEEGKRENFKDK